MTGTTPAAPGSSRRVGPPRRGYHHGALKDALVEAARTLVAEKGPNGFTLLDAARLSGVSPSAPYRHFKDKRALLDEVARRGFALFSGRLSDAWQAGGPDPKSAFLSMGAAYLAFAREEPGYYGAMFGRDTAGEAPAQQALVEDTSFETLLQAVRRLAPASPLDPRLIALHVWSLSHGVATLFLRERPEIPVKPELVLQTAVETYLAGLASGPTRQSGENAENL